MTKQGKRRYNREKERVDENKLGGLKNGDFKKKEEEKGQMKAKKGENSSKSGAERRKTRAEKQK